MKEQKQFTKAISKALKENGVTISWFLQQVKITRPHWFHICKGKRVLTQERRDLILQALKIRAITLETTKQ